jgi:hypothetical protein
MHEQSRHNDVPDADAFRGVHRWADPVQPKKENYRNPKHRGDPERPPCVEIGGALVSRNPRHRKGERARHEEKLHATRTLGEDLSERIWKVRESL